VLSKVGVLRLAAEGHPRSSGLICYRHCFPHTQKARRGGGLSGAVLLLKYQYKTRTDLSSTFMMVCNAQFLLGQGNREERDALCRAPGLPPTPGGVSEVAPCRVAYRWGAKLLHFESVEERLPAHMG